MVYSEQTWTSGSAGGTPINGPRLQHMEDGIYNAATRAEYGTVAFDSFAGANDDAILAAAMSAVGAETYPRTITLSNRLYSFSTGNVVPYEGFRLHGPWGYSNPERNSGNKVAAPISLNMNGPWFTASTSTIYGVSFANLALEGHGTNATFIGGSTGSFYCLAIENISASALRSVLGTQASKLLITAASFTGWWEINNSYSGAFHLGGSDNTLWTDGMLLDSGTAFNTSGSSNGQYHLWLDFCEKTFIGPLYITAEGAWNGVRVSGPTFNAGGGNLGGPVWIHGARIEGRNAGAPCNGALVRVDGGSLNLRDCWISYGMASPATPGHSPADAGIIHQEGGQLLVDGCTYDHATSVAETVPWVYSNATGDAVVTAAQRGSKGGAWTGRPRFARPVANAENRIADATVTQITV